MKKSPCGPCLEFESSSHRCLSLGFVLTLNELGNCRDQRTSSIDSWCPRQASASDQSSTVVVVQKDAHMYLSLKFAGWHQGHSIYL